MRKSINWLVKEGVILSGKMALAFIFIEFGCNQARDGMRNIFEGTKENL